MTDQITVPKQTWDALREALENFIGNELTVGQRYTNAGQAMLDALSLAESVAHALSAESVACLELKLPGGRKADQWESARVADYNQGWNDYRNAAKAALAAANAVSAPKGLFVDLIASHGPEFVAEMADLSLTNEGDMLAKQPEILAQYSGFNGHRQWATARAWLYPGDAIAVISDHFRGVTKMVQPLGWYCVSRDGLVTQCADQRDAEMTAKSGDRDWPGSAPYRAVQLCEFEAHPQATEPAWRPIETAPKDGSDILLAHPDGSMVVGWWRENGLHGRVSGWSDGDNFAMTWPSHWMPIPAAPEEKQ